MKAMRKHNPTNRAAVKQALWNGVERRRRPRVPYRDFPAGFVTQIVSTRALAAGEPAYILPPRNPAVEAYRSGARITVRRAPAGISHTETA